MARNVGSIEVTVEASTGKLTAQLRTAGRRAGEAAASEIDRALNDVPSARTLARIRQRIQRGLEGVEAEVGVSLNSRDLRRTIAELEALAELADVDVNIGATLDRSSVETALTQIRAMVEAAEIKVSLGADVNRPAVHTAIAEIEATVAAVDADISIGGDVNASQVLAALARAETLASTAGGAVGSSVGKAIDRQFADIAGPGLRNRLFEIRAQIGATLSGIAADIGAEVDDPELTAALAKIDARVSAADSDVNIGAVMDSTQVASTLAKIEALTSASGGGFGQAGTQAGKAFSNGLSSSLAQGGVAVAGVIALIAQPLAVAIEGSLGAAVAVVSSGMSALIGTVGAAVPILAALGTTVGTLAIGFEGLGAALDGDADALARLTPEARAFVDAFDGVRPMFDEIRRTVQAGLFAGLADELTRVAAAIGPAIGEGLAVAADSLNTFFRNLADIAVDTDFAGLFAELQPVTDSLLRALEDVAATIVPFLQAAAPAAEVLAGFIAEGAEALREFVSSSQGADKITDFLVEGLESLREWGGLARTVGDALITLFDAGRDAGDGFVASLAGTIDRFDAWMESVDGQDALAGFFERAREVMGALAPLVKGLIGFFDRIITPEAVERFGQMADTVGDLLPVLGTLINISADVLDVFVTLADLGAETLGVLAAAWEAIPDPIKRVGMAFATSGLTEVGTVIEGIIDAVGWLVDRLGDLEGAFDFDLPDWVPFIDSGTGVTATFRDIEVGANGAGKAWGDLGDKAKKVAKVTEEAADTTEKAAIAADKHAAAMKEQRAAAERLIERFTQVIKAADELADISGVFEQIGARQDALSAIFDIGNAPLDAAASVRDIGLAIDELSDTAEGVNVGDILAGNLKADDVLDAIDSMRPQIQAQITDAFAAGGPEAATAMATDYIAQVADELNISEIDAAKLLGLEGIEATIAVALKLADVDKARRQLEILTGLTGETPWSASVALALDREGITDQEVAEILAGIEARLRAEGVIIPIDTTLTPPSGEDLYNLVNAGLMAQGFEPIDIPLDVLPPTAAEAEPVINAALAAVNLNPITADVTGPLPSDLEDAIDFVTAGIVPDPVKVPVEFDLAAVTGPVDLISAAGSTPQTFGPTVEVTATLNTEGFDNAAEGIRTAVDGLNSSTAEVSVTVPDYDTVIGQTDDIQGAVDTLDETTATPTITVNTSAAVTSVGNLQRAIDNLRGKSVSVTVAGIQGQIDKVRELDREIDGLRSRTITITTNLVTTGTPASMAGRIVNGPMLTTVGERHYREAIIPLDLPLNRISPDVRHLAELIRGGGTTSGAVPSIGKQFVVTQNIQPVSADPKAVATQVINRMVAAVNR